MFLINDDQAGGTLSHWVEEAEQHNTTTPATSYNLIKSCVFPTIKGCGRGILHLDDILYGNINAMKECVFHMER